MPWKGLFRIILEVSRFRVEELLEHVTFEAVKGPIEGKVDGLRLCDHQPEHDDQRQERRPSEREPDAKPLTRLRTQGPPFC